MSATAADVELAHRVQMCLDDRVRPLLQSHGGDAEIVWVDEGVVTLRFLAACQSCHYKSWTMLAVVESRLLEIDGVREVEVTGSPVSRHARERMRAILAGASATEPKPTSEQAEAEFE